MNSAAKAHSPYAHLAWMMALSFAAMYGLMYAMVDVLGHVYHNVNQVYMAGLMAGAMLILELAVMWGMYPKKQLNAALLVAGLGLTVACWAMIRDQSGVGDRQFLRSMIPHHASAILMCEEADVKDSEIQALCAQIVSGQRKEIRQMQAMLNGLKS